MNRLGPASLGMKELFASTFLEIPYASFCDAILEVSIDAAETNGLALRLRILNESFIRKATIISMVVLDANVVSSSVSFESVFSFDRLIRSQLSLEVHVRKTAVVIHKDSSCAVALLCRATFH